MAITTADGWFAAVKQTVLIRKTAGATSVASIPFTTLDLTGNPGAGSLAIGNTANGLVPTDVTAGFPLIKAFSGANTGYLANAKFRSSVIGGAALYDRLFHAGSFSLATLQTFTLASQPSYTSRLPGGTDYGNLVLFLEVNTAIAASAVTVAIGYTNEAGTAGRTTGASASLASLTTRRLIEMPYQAGDKGIQKIDSVTIGGTVAATGTVNVVVARKLAEFDVRIVNGLDAQGWDLLGAPEIFADSAFWLVCQPDSTSTGLPSLSLDIVNG